MAENGGGRMKKSFWVPLAAAVGTMAGLYLIGFLTDIELFAFKWSLSYTEISLIPIIIGLLVALICDWQMKKKHTSESRQKQQF